MMSGAEIILLNPQKSPQKKRQRTKKKGSTMARKRTKRIRPRSTALQVRRNPPSNPTRRRRSSSRSGGVGGALGGLQVGPAVVDAAKNAGGMLAASFFARRFSGGGGLRDVWTFQNYLMAVLGGFASGLLAEMVQKGSGKQFLQGAIGLSLYRIVSDTMAARVPFVSDNFGASDQDAGFLGTDGNRYLPGDVYPALNGESYVMGEDGNWRSTSDDWRALQGNVQPAGPLGDLVQPAGPLGNVQPAGPLGGVN